MMKNIKILLLCLCMLLVPCIVMADAGGPTFSTYDIRVKNPDGTEGIQEFDYEGEKVSVKKTVHYDYDKIIKEIVFEEKINGEFYAYSQGERVYLKVADIEAYGEVDLEKFKQEKSAKIYVFKEGAYLYKGPSKVYGKVENDVMVPVGTTLEYNYRDELFAYVTYKGVNGWVYICQQNDGTEGSCPYDGDSSIADVESGEIIIPVDNAKIYKDVSGKEALTTVPKWKKLEYKYTYSYNYFRDMYYVTYNGVSGWVSDAAHACEDCTIFTHLKSVKICSAMEEECKNSVGTLPKNTIIPIKYYVRGFDSYYYLEYNGKSGWVYGDAYEGVDSNNVYSGNEVFKLKINAKLYSDIYGKETENIIDAGEIVVDYNVPDNGNYESEYSWLHVIKGDNKGWIKVKNKNIEFIRNEEIKKPSGSESKAKNKDNEPNVLGVPFEDFMIYSIFGTVLLALTIVVIIVLVNKNKKVEVKEENKE